MTVRPVPLLVGSGCLAGAVLVVAGVVSTDLNRPLLIVVGVALTIGSLRIPLLRRSGRSIGTLPAADRRPSVPVPGATLADAVAQFRRATSGFETHRDRIVGDLRGAAVAVLTRFGGRTEQDAVEAIDAGTWTDDPRAGALLSTGRPGRRSFAGRASSLLPRTDVFHADARRAAAEIASVCRSDDGDAVDTDDRPLESGDSTTPTVHRTATVDVDGVVPDDRRRTGHWTGISVVGLLAAGAGAVVGSPAAIVAGAVGVGYAGVARSFEAPVADITIERTVGETTPEPGEEVDVALTVTNESGRLLSDLRIVDGVPGGLVVEDGPARLGTALRPGERTTLTYTVTARRGTHRFDPVRVITRDPTSAAEASFLAGSETTIECEPTIRSLDAPVPLRRSAAAFSGRLTTEEGGPGTEFHSLREYRHGDPLSRVDWKAHARTGDLATRRFHEERAARVLLLIDARVAAYRAPAEDEPHAVDRAADAAGSVAASLLDRGDTVGLAAIGPTDRPGETATEPCWLAPSSGDSHRVRLQHLLADHPQLSTVPPEDRIVWSGQLSLLRRRLRSETQIVLFTPLCDFGSMAIARRLDARGHAVTVVSPDPSADRTASQQLAGVGRRMRALDLEGLGVPVVDWPHDEPLESTFRRVNAGERL